MPWLTSIPVSIHRWDKHSKTLNHINTFLAIIATTSASCAVSWRPTIRAALDKPVSGMTCRVGVAGRALVVVPLTSVLAHVVLAFPQVGSVELAMPVVAVRVDLVAVSEGEAVAVVVELMLQSQSR